MDHVTVNYGPKFVYLLFFDCPNCHKLITFHEYGNSEKTEDQLRAGAYPATCKCGFDGGLYGSVMNHSVELEWER